MSENTSNEDFLDLALDYMFSVNRLLNSVEVPADIRAELWGKRDALARALAREDAGIHSGLWAQVIEGEPTYVR
jgi:hypothetical protein